MADEKRPGLMMVKMDSEMQAEIAQLAAQVNSEGKARIKLAQQIDKRLAEISGRLSKIEAQFGRLLAIAKVSNRTMVNFIAETEGKPPPLKTKSVQKNVHR